MDATVAILAGGLGTRISGVLGDTPKVLAPIGGRPFLAWMLDGLQNQGCRHVILLLGHLAEKVDAYLDANPREGLLVERVYEPRPMGTLGALRNAGAHLMLGDLIVMNGDTYVQADLKELLRHHREVGTPITMLCVHVADGSRYGRVDLTGDGLVRRFFEKDPNRHGPGLVNAGVTVFSTRAVAMLLKAPGQSLERDFLETLPQGSMAAHVVDAPFIDIGTPESLAEAAKVMGVER